MQVQVVLRVQLVMLVLLAQPVQQGPLQLSPGQLVQQEQVQPAQQEMRDQRAPPVLKVM